MIRKKSIIPVCDNNFLPQLLEEKKSKFYSYIFYIEDDIQVDKILKEIANKNINAKHIVYAYRLVNDGKYTDDKEPQNTAGKPIYDILEKKNIVNCLIVVVRYFGGVLLGTGLLTRTYKNVALKIIDITTFNEYIEYENKEKCIEYSEEKTFTKKIELMGGSIDSITRDDKVHIKYRVKKIT